MKTSKHEILKTQWKQNIKDQNKSGLTIRDWCSERGITHGRYYYWLKIIREETLIKVGTLAVTGQAQFAEVKPTIKTETKFDTNGKGTCAIFRSNGNVIEILKGADLNTLGIILNLIGR